MESLSSLLSDAEARREALLSSANAWLRDNLPAFEDLKEHIQFRHVMANGTWCFTVEAQNATPPMLSFIIEMRPEETVSGGWNVTLVRSLTVEQTEDYAARYVTLSYTMFCGAPQPIADFYRLLRVGFLKEEEYQTMVARMHVEKKKK